MSDRLTEGHSGRRKKRGKMKKMIALIDYILANGF